MSKSKLGQKGPNLHILYSSRDRKIKFNNYGFFEVSNSLLRPVFENCDIMAHS